ncbi:hypothetical protein ACFV2N_32225 [Streptomyces sp. NPDC059680]|uniref:hypothetical protein n=1 Tax=Streptomyces sp. NPDC059680 TaxID=3346904 RepID=UPI00367EC169
MSAATPGPAGAARRNRALALGSACCTGRAGSVAEAMRSGVQKRIASSSEKPSSPVSVAADPLALAEGEAEGEAEGSPVAAPVEGLAEAEGAGSPDGAADVPADGTAAGDRWGADVAS